VKPRYIGIAIALFLVLIFLDQNRVSVPLKLFLGKPFQVELSVIVIVSVLIGMLIAISVIFFIKRVKRIKERR
jgi:uncharacterized integral membrane protein